MKDWRNRDDIMHIIEWTSVGGWFSGTTWKDAYCSKYGDNDSGAMCQRPGDNNNGG